MLNIYDIERRAALQITQISTRQYFKMQLKFITGSSLSEFSLLFGFPLTGVLRTQAPAKQFTISIDGREKRLKISFNHRCHNHFLIYHFSPSLVSATTCQATDQRRAPTSQRSAVLTRWFIAFMERWLPTAAMLMRWTSRPSSRTTVSLASAFFMALWNCIENRFYIFVAELMLTRKKWKQKVSSWGEACRNRKSFWCRVCLKNWKRIF